MSWVSVISFIGCLLIILYLLRNKVDVFSPGKIFALVWLLAIGLTDLKLSRLQHEWPPIVWLQVLIGPFTFLLGAGLVYIIKLNKEICTIETIRNYRNQFNLNTSRIYSTIILLFVLFIFGYGVIYLYTGEIPIFSPKPGVARANFTMFGIGLFLHNVVLIVLFTVIYSILVQEKTKKKLLLGALSVISVGLYSLTLQRYQIFMTILLVIILLYYTTYKIKLSTTLITGVVIVVFFFLVSSFRAGEIIILVLYKISKMKFSPEYAVFTEPYMYVTMNLENFARSIEKIEEYSFGYYTFDFVTAITGLKHWISEYFFMTENPFLISSYNTYSAFWTYYRDFGVLGISVIPFFGGVGISSLYYSLREKPTLFKISIYGMLIYGIVFSFFNSIFGFLWYVYNVVVLIVVFKFISNK
ncbi:MAG TPA: O-antigen polymerase [Melioribacteraceae bacterium]|nr:O-antigen polymerase [Melioribacteraceae bacterium]